jgi:hypothetical protein
MLGDYQDNKLKARYVRSGKVELEKRPATTN